MTTSTAGLATAGAYSRRVHEPWRFEWRSGLLRDELRPGEDWLDLGTGSGRFLEVAPNGIGVDPDPDSPGGELADVAGAAVDLVWCSEVIEHVADPLALLFEARRVLRPGGRLLLTTPAHPWLRRVAIAAVRFDAHFDPMGGHLRFFTERSLRRTLAAAHFGDIRISTKHATLIARAARG
jgi:ubiquinone/menaquinone biosynthesis C-methylase UbiE